MRMGRRPRDLTGKRFGRLVVQSKAQLIDGQPLQWIVKCDCGKVFEVRAKNLHCGKSKSCGCARLESLTKHGLCRHPLYVVWERMLDRCHRPSSPAYRWYGARGIAVCDRWKDFAAFYVDVIDGYQRGLEIDRIDNDGNYEPGNVRWATCKQNQRNKRNNVYVEWSGERITIAELAEMHDMPYRRLWKRLQVFGWPIEAAVSVQKLTGQTQGRLGKASFGRVTEAA